MPKDITAYSIPWSDPDRAKRFATGWRNRKVMKAAIYHHKQRHSLFLEVNSNPDGKSRQVAIELSLTDLFDLCYMVHHDPLQAFKDHDKRWENTKSIKSHVRRLKRQSFKEG